MPVFNAEAWLRDSLASVRNQTHTDWEFLAINDGSTDSSLSILNDFANEFSGRVRIVTIPNSGPSVARNIGMHMALGDVIALIDADDVWDNQKLEIQYQWLTQNPAAVACTCDFGIYSNFDQNPERLIHFDWTQQMVNRWAFLEGYGPGLCSTLMIKTATARQIGGFNELVSNAEDTEFALRILTIGTIGCPKGELMRYRVSPNQNHSNLSTILPGIESLMGLEPFEHNNAFQRRAKSNAFTLIAIKYAMLGQLRLSIVNLGRALGVSFVSPMRFIGITVIRKWRN